MAAVPFHGFSHLRTQQRKAEQQVFIWKGWGLLPLLPQHGSTSTRPGLRQRSQLPDNGRNKTSRHCLTHRLPACSWGEVAGLGAASSHMRAQMHTEIRCSQRPIKQLCRHFNQCLGLGVPVAAEREENKSKPLKEEGRGGSETESSSPCKWHLTAPITSRLQKWPLAAQQMVVLCFRRSWGNRHAGAGLGEMAHLSLVVMLSLITSFWW